MAKPTSYEAITGNPPHTLRVEFQSRLQENTNVTWYKDGDSNAIPEGEIQTKYMDDGLNASTQLVFVAVTRSDRGVYRVVIENDNDIIPLNQSRREANFQLNITGESLVSVLIPPSPGGKKKKKKKKAGLGLGTRL